MRKGSAERLILRDIHIPTARAVSTNAWSVRNSSPAVCPETSSLYALTPKKAAGTRAAAPSSLVMSPAVRLLRKFLLLTSMLLNEAGFLSAHMSVSTAAAAYISGEMTTNRRSAERTATASWIRSFPLKSAMGGSSPKYSKRL